MKRSLPALFAVAALLAVFGLVLSFGDRISLQPATTVDARPAAAGVVAQVERSPLPTPQPTAALSPLESIQLGEPQVVLTHSSAIGVIEWLPNSQEVLLTLQQPDVLTETIEIFNIASGKRRFLAARPAEAARPVWLDKVKRLAFALRPDLSEVVYELRLNNLADSQIPHRPEGPGRIAATISGRGDRLLAVQNGRAEILRVAPNGQVSVESTVDLKDAGFEPGDWRTRFRSEWSVAGDKVAIFDVHGFAIFAPQTGELRQYDLGAEASEAWGYGPRWVYDARWSPDGERIALITTGGETDGTGIRFSDLTILDVDTSDFINQKIGDGFVADVVWSPQGDFLAVLAVIGSDQIGVERQGLFLVVNPIIPFESHLDFRQMASDFNLGGNWGKSLVWLAIRPALLTPCPKRLQENPPIVEARLCAISVNIKAH